MQLPPEYLLIRVVSPGPSTTVALARDAEGTTRIVKRAAVERAGKAIAQEARVLRALETAGVEGVPRLVGEWVDVIAMEWLAMATLGERADAMRADATLRESAVRAAFGRLEAVHAVGVVHGDVSPGNVFLANDGQGAAIADFGLARLVGDADPERAGESLGGDGAFRGTLLYVAPEVARGEPFDGRADDYALAASLLHMATGVPLRGMESPDASPASVLVNAGSRPFDASHPWRALAPALFPRTMADALFRCLAFDPRDRARDEERAW
jgi:serine/threonine protein kinase